MTESCIACSCAEKVDLLACSSCQTRRPNASVMRSCKKCILDGAETFFSITWIGGEASFEPPPTIICSACEKLSQQEACVMTAQFLASRADPASIAKLAAEHTPWLACLAASDPVATRRALRRLKFADPAEGLSDSLADIIGESDSHAAYALASIMVSTASDSATEAQKMHAKQALEASRRKNCFRAKWTSLIKSGTQALCAFLRERSIKDSDPLTRALASERLFIVETLVLMNSAIKTKKGGLLPSVEDASDATKTTVLALLKHLSAVIKDASRRQTAKTELFKVLYSPMLPFLVSATEPLPRRTQKPSLESTHRVTLTPAKNPKQNRNRSRSARRKKQTPVSNASRKDNQNSSRNDSPRKRACPNCWVGKKESHYHTIAHCRDSLKSACFLKCRTCKELHWADQCPKRSQ